MSTAAAMTLDETPDTSVSVLINTITVTPGPLPLMGMTAASQKASA